MHCSVGVDIISILYHLYVDISLLHSRFSVAMQHFSQGSWWGSNRVGFFSEDSDLRDWRLNI